MQTRTNIDGVKNLLELARQKQIKRFIHTSSVVVYGMHSKIKNVTEEMPKAGKNSWINYVKTKTITEEIVLNCKDIDCVVINPTHIIGPGDRHNWARLIKMIAEAKLPSIPNGAGSFVDVRNVASGIITAFHKGVNGENYLLGGTDLNFKQFVYKVAEKLKVKPTKIQLPNYLLKTLAHSKNFISRFSNTEPDITPESVALISDLYACDAAKARKAIDYQTFDFNKTLDDTIAFLVAEGLIQLDL
jgi:nucleoside-diphosphate-sugar epimerase